MVHGGDIYRNEVRLDFSVNINPLGIPESVESAMRNAVSLCTRYPDIKAEKLKREISAMSGVKEQYIVCGNGASELFMAIVHALHPKKAVIPVPSFFGYEYVSAAAECEVNYIPMPEETGFGLKHAGMLKLEEDTDLLILANPNNPVGNLIEPEVLEEILRECRDKNITVILDECFIEFTEKEETHSMKTKIEAYPNVLVVRAFTKIFAVPGVRLGYLFCADDVLKTKIEKQLPEWNLSVFAQEAGAAACRETEYCRKTAEFIRKEREYLKSGLEEAGLKVFESAADFMLLYTELPLYDRLLAKKILIRDCGGYRGLKKGYYRAAVKTREENRQLIEAVRECAAEAESTRKQI